jgi:di/tricarboxylate transporter
MAKKKWIIVILCLVGGVFIYEKFIRKPHVNYPVKPPSAVSIDVVEAKGPSSQAPSHVSVRMKDPLKSLVAGDTGSFEIDVTLKGGGKGDEKTLAWDPKAANPVVISIASSPKSGITFIDENHPEKPAHHHLVRFHPPKDPHSKTVSAKVAYVVKSDTKAGKHALWMDITAELTDAENHEIHDVSIVKLPFKVDTHLRTKLLMLFVVGIAVFLFIIEWVRVDVVGILMMVLLPELNLINAHDTFRGLSSNAVVAIIGVMIISYGLNRTGIVGRILQPMLGFVGKSAPRVVTLFSSLIACISSVMQNTGAAVLFLPAIRLIASRKLKMPVSRILMPIGMAAILGGTITMIGTSPLILLNDILPQGMPKFGLLELSPIGLAISAGGILYLSTIGMYFLSKRRQDQPTLVQDDAPCAEEDGPLSSYPLVCGPYEIRVPEDYRAGSDPQEVFNIWRKYMVNIVAIGSDDGTHDIAPLPDTVLQPGFVICVYSPRDAIHRFVADYGLELRKEPKIFKNTMFNPSIAGVVEVMLSPRSQLIGETIKDVGFRRTFGVNPMAIHKNGVNYYQELADMTLESGDTILIHGTWEHFHALQESHQNFIFITPFEDGFHKPEKAGRAAISFAIAFALMLVSSFYFQSRPYNPMPLSVCLMIGALFMIVTKVMTINEAYRAVDWRTVFLLGGLIPLGMAVDQTGTAAWIAKGIIAALGGLMSAKVLLIVLACLSCAFTMVISNVGACALLVPLGVSIANQIGIDPRVAVIVVGIGVSNSFILPTHQVNALYMGPGEYRTKDYIKIGGLLSIIYIAILVTMTYCFYL